MTRDTAAATNIEKMLVKQGKQIRALYELGKKTIERIDSIHNQLKKLNEKTIDLSPKVFSVSILIILYYTVYYRYLTLWVTHRYIT